MSSENSKSAESQYRQVIQTNMEPKNMPHKSQEIEKKSDNKLVNDQKWYNFVTKRAQMGKRETKIDTTELKAMMNPFTQELVIEVSTRLDPEAKIKDENGLDIPASSVIEKAKYAKVYQSAAMRDRAMNLSATAMRMYVFIMYEIEENQDYIHLEPEWYKEVSGAGSRNMYKKAVDELMRYGYITTTKFKQWYWVNPVLIYCGNRIKKYKDNVVMKNVYTGRPQPKYKGPKKEGMTLTKKRVYNHEQGED